MTERKITELIGKGIGITCALVHCEEHGWVVEITSTPIEEEEDAKLLARWFLEAVNEKAASEGAKH